MVDSAEIYFSKAKSLGLLQSSSPDTVKLRIYYLKLAINFEARDSFWAYLADEYRWILGKRIESQKYTLKALTAPIHSGVTDEAQFNQYLGDLMLTGKYKKELRILKGHNGDTIIFKKRHIYFSDPQLEIKRIKEDNKTLRDSIRSWKSAPNEFVYELMPTYYLHTGRHLQAHICIKQGLKKFPGSGLIYCELGRIYLMEGKYKKCAEYMAKASAVGYQMGSILLPHALLRLKIQ